MTSKEIRNEFLEFFKERGHTIVPSASLVPQDDPTLLFTNAGMNQFKDIFLNQGTRPYTRATDSQKIMRVSGKHNDLDEVGRDTYHHTFFEMLGNWSFGDYGKKEAITWAWELLTKVWKLPKDKLYATVHEKDDESFAIWETQTDIGVSHISRFGDKENFWEMGDVGPCGPCTEIHMDMGENAARKKGTPGVNGSDGRFVELWNLVFTEFDRQKDSSLLPLPKKHVDTGMGLERICAVLQNKDSNYDTDLFTPIIEAISKYIGPYNEDDGTAHRVIADHIRALVFTIGDGVLPSNEGRGYVIRKILRRALRFGKEKGLDKPFLYELADTVVNEMGDIYPEISKNQEMIKNILYAEELSFFKTLNKGYRDLEALLQKTKNNTFSGKDLFFLYDSLGFPVDFTTKIVEDKGMTLDMEGFNKCMEEQKNKARASWKVPKTLYQNLDHFLSKTIYVDDYTYTLESEVSDIFVDGEYKEKVEKDETLIFVTPKTIFYGEKGGQVGDIGSASTKDATLTIFDTKIYKGMTIHFATMQGKMQKGDKILLKVDEENRNNIRKYHTATHLLHSALRQVLGEHVTQAGSLVTANHLRFDFTHPKALKPEELKKVENIVNKTILENIPLKIYELPIKEAKDLGAMAIFEEKYGDIVRVIEIKDISKELCGGSHVNRTGDIGLFKVLSDASVAAGTRRIEALCGMDSLYKMEEEEDLLLLIEEKLKNKDFLGQIDEILKKNKDLLKEKEENEKKDVLSFIEKSEQKIQKMEDKNLLILETDKYKKSLKYICDELKNRNRNLLTILIFKDQDKALVSVSLTKDLLENYHAGKMIQNIAQNFGGKGGGRADFAQAGISYQDNLIEKIKNLIK